MGGVRPDDDELPEQRGAARSWGGCGGEQRPVDQHREQVRGLLDREPDGGGGRAQAERPGQRGQPPVHELLGGGEQAVPPVQRGLQGLPSFGLGTPDPGQSHGVGADLVADLVQPVDAGTGGGELDGERETVEIRADLGGALAHLAGHVEPGHGRAQPRDEQVHSGRVQWRDRVEHLAVEVEGFAAGGEHRDRSARAEHRGHGLRGVGEQVLAVVDDQQHPPPADRGAQGLLGRARRRRRAADRRADDLGDRLPALHRGEVDEPHPVRVRGRRLPGDLDGQAGLPGAGGPRQRDQPMLTQQPGHRGELGRAPDQVGHRGGQVDLVVRGLIPCLGCDGCDVVLQDLPLHLPQLLPGGDAQLVAQGAADLLVDGERLLGAATSVERRHVQGAEVLAERPFADQAVELRQGALGAAGADQRVQPALGRLGLQLGHAAEPGLGSSAGCPATARAPRRTDRGTRRDGRGRPPRRARRTGASRAGRR